MILKNKIKLTALILAVAVTCMTEVSVHAQEEHISEQNITEEDTAEYTDRVLDRSDIPDPKLYAAIQSSLGPSVPVTTETVKDITYLYAFRKNISDLTGISYLENLTLLDLGNNDITEVTELKYLKHLEKLSLDNNELENISGLEQLTSLKNLNISNNQLTDVAELRHLTGLVELSTDGNELTLWNLLTQIPEQFCEDNDWMTEMWTTQKITRLRTETLGAVLEAPKNTLSRKSSGTTTRVTYTGSTSEEDHLFGNNAARYTLYDLTLSEKPDGRTTMHIPVPSGYNESALGIITLDEDGNYKKLDFLLYNGTAVFQTDHSSVCAIVEFADTAAGIHTLSTAGSIDTLRGHIAENTTLISHIDTLSSMSGAGANRRFSVKQIAVLLLLIPFFFLTVCYKRNQLAHLTLRRFQPDFQI